jgi:hypothetical protein
MLKKSLESNHMKLKKEHVLLEMKYQELELASEDIGSSGHAMLGKSLKSMLPPHVMI